jgi:acyl-coenzyme A synthetase/AMP-(fatty) acid ligase
MSVLLTGATIVLYDESPLEPDPHIVLKIAADTKSTCLGMGAKIWDEYQKMNVDFSKLIFIFECLSFKRPLLI